MRLLHHLPTLLYLLGSLGVCAQQADRAPQQLIVQLREGVNGKYWAHQQREIVAWKSLGTSLNAWVVQLEDDLDPSLFTQQLRTRDRALHNVVVHVQPNYRLSLRKRPDDDRYARQWQHRNTGQTGGPTGLDYNLEAAWDITTGGLTPNGDTIVIASIDNGVDLDHEDLVANLWINRDEVPGNGLDDDRNGYVDDVYGWNTALETNDVEAGGGDHGTPVMGQIAARGNNGVGVTGVNWRAKVMSVTNDFDPLESEVIQAYSYVLEARKRYDATGGKEGAYVVATNASWGRSRAFPSQSPIWCALYDSLGAHGILNIAAVPNENVDVDAVGDLPALCGSDYLVIVTSLDDRNEKVINAARGRTSVDLGAYGEGVYTTRLGNDYGEVSGTSFATPAVTGAVGLLYSVPCASLAELLRTDPAAAALRIKQTLLANVRPLASLTEATSSGGGLDVGSAVQSLLTDCGACTAPTSFVAAVATDGSSDLLLDWKQPGVVESVRLQYRPRGTRRWSQVVATAPYRLSGLDTCSTYELQLIADCTGERIDTTAVLEASTGGCCAVPEVQLAPLAGGRIEASWAASAASGYTLRYRLGGEAWTELPTDGNQLTVTGLRGCRTYEFSLRRNCTAGVGFSRLSAVKTLGCGVCLDATYCTPTSFLSEREWIAGVDLPGVLTRTSERETGGYSNNGDLIRRPVVQGGVYPIVLTPGYRGAATTEDFHVYIDWNQDSTFSRDELVVQRTAGRNGPAAGEFTVPADALTGLTRMRVEMQFISVTADGCPDNDREYRGEVEDYCIRVATAVGCPPPDSLTASFDSDRQVTTLSWLPSAAAGQQYRVRYRPRGSDEDFRERSVSGTTTDIADLDLCASYEVRVASTCDDGAGADRTVYFGDDCTAADEPRLPASRWSVYPNPATDEVLLEWSTGVVATDLTVFSVAGHLVSRQTIASGAGEASLRVTGWVPGVYVLRLTTADGMCGYRRVVVQ